MSHYLINNREQWRSPLQGSHFPTQPDLNYLYDHTLYIMTLQDAGRIVQFSVAQKSFEKIKINKVKAQFPT